MRSTWAALPILAALAGCGDPLDGIERLSELPGTLPETPAAAALPDAAEAAQPPILAGLFRRPEPRDATDPGIVAALREANGLEPAPVEAVAQAEESEAVVDPIAAPAETAERRGVLGWLRRAAENEGAKAGADEPPVVQADTDDAPAAEEPAQVPQDVQVASLEVTTPTPPKRRGLFGLRNTPASPAARPQTRKGPDAQDVAVGTVLPFGEIARVCDAKARNMGKIVARAARKGRGYVLYDSAPDSPDARTFYVTGFSDNCPRQFTASIALFGEPVLHEQLRYGLPARDFPYSATDEAYEKLKARVCNVGRTKPCGPRISRLENTTTFVSIYENFGENARWNDILLHDGEVLAAALKTP
ncbi:MAG: hypothetical protein AAFU86_02730 [Pseudomonadota bacterium]